MSKFGYIVVVVGLMFSAFGQNAALAQYTPEHRKELNEMTKTVNGVSAIIKKKEYQEAQKILMESSSRLEEIVQEAKGTANDPPIRKVLLQIMKQQGLVEKGMAKEKPVVPEKPISFMKEIAPVVINRCVGCHGAENPRNRLRLDSFAGWKTGGQSGQMIIPENAFRSMMIARLHAPEGKGRMPANGEALSDEQKQLFIDWVNQGAKFDGESEDKTFADLIYEEEAKSVTIPKPKGGEQVLFTRDIAPWFTNLCLNCHNSRRKSGGLSVETFFDIMKGGDSGEVVIPGDMENSRLFRLVGGLELPRMPQGQARITKKNYDDLVTWFKEGNSFDGADPRAPISSFVPSEEEVLLRNLAGLSTEAFQKLREDRTNDAYRRAISKEQHPKLTGDHFLITGNVPEDRLKQVESWAVEELAKLQKSFNNDQNPFRGRLAILVLKDRFSYNEFSEVVERRRADPESTGHSKVTAGQEDAYIVLVDTGDQAGKDPVLKAVLIENLTSAYMKKSGRPIPEWAARGIGLAMADQAVPDKQRADAIEKVAIQQLGTLSKPEDLFNEGVFSPSGTAAVGYSITKYLLASGGQEKFVSFINAIEGGANVGAALQSSYGASPATIAAGYLSSRKLR
ncbi:c-type cytochrome domain-containing protein [Planctomicrobium sp. SH668]|uniref:c-type cytochrome domain-containing protein n=1 Tax=Planctomicrobium sp. SH668 TaxID=3448126 RepID=UPI003F5B8BE0